MLSELQAGSVIKPHGLKGEAKVFVTSDDPKKFETLDSVTILRGNERRDVAIESVRYFKNVAIIKFKGIDSVEEIRKYTGCDLVIPRSKGLPLEDGEYYIGDLIGCRVYKDTEELLGTLTDVFKTGANDVYEVTLSDGKTVLIPAIKECILEMEPEDERIVVHMLDGLM